MPKKRKKKKNKKIPIDVPDKKKVEILPEQKKEFYLLQIELLENQIKQIHHDDMILGEKNADEYATRELRETRLNDAYRFLKNQYVEGQYDQMDLHDRLRTMQQYFDEQQRIYNQKVKELEAKYEESLGDLIKENQKLKEELASLNKYIIERQEIMEEMRKLQSRLADDKEYYEKYINELHKKSVLDRDLLKRRMIQKVNTLATEYQQLFDQRLAQTTKRALRENLSLNNQILKISDNVAKLLKENETLKLENSKAKATHQLLKGNEVELAKKTVASRKIIKALTTKLKIESNVNREYDERLTNFENYGKNQAMAFQLSGTRLSSNRSSQMDIITSLKGTIKNMESDKEESRHLEQNVIELLGRAVYIIATAMNSSSTSKEGVTKNNILQELLALLNCAAQFSIGADFKKYVQELFDDPTMAYSGHLGEVICQNNNSKKIPPHYVNGNIGFIRPVHLAEEMKQKASLTFFNDREFPLRQSIDSEIMTKVVELTEIRRVGRQPIDNKNCLPGMSLPEIKPIPDEILTSKYFLDKAKEMNISQQRVLFSCEPSDKKEKK
ncbi:hypothetical protein SNEBB_001519 [Seison nebaliae]|nr:hypothetical protein SNEBB_001519 [Seison nebaliae]